jgi:hypothetical protein
MWGSTFAEIARKAQELQDQAASTVVRCSCGGGGRSNAFVVWSGETSDSIIVVVVDGWLAGIIMSLVQKDHAHDHFCSPTHE